MGSFGVLERVCLFLALFTRCIRFYSLFLVFWGGGYLERGGSIVRCKQSKFWAVRVYVLYGLFRGVVLGIGLYEP